MSQDRRGTGRDADVEEANRKISRSGEDRPRHGRVFVGRREELAASPKSAATEPPKPKGETERAARRAANANDDEGRD